MAHPPSPSSARRQPEGANERVRRRVAVAGRALARAPPRLAARLWIAALAALLATNVALPEGFAYPAFSVYLLVAGLVLAAAALLQLAPREGWGGAGLAGAIAFAAPTALMASIWRVDKMAGPVAPMRYSPFAVLLQLGTLLVFARPLERTTCMVRALSCARQTKSAPPATDSTARACRTGSASTRCRPAH